MDKWYLRYKLFYDIVRDSIGDNANVLIIGANDGTTRDPLFQVWRSGWNAYFVEPNPSAQERLIASRDGRVIPYACGYGGKVKLWRMTDGVANAYKKAKGDDGSCLTSFDREHITKRLERGLSALVEKHGLDEMVTDFEVDCLTIGDMIARDLIPADIHLAQIDVEGMEPDIVPQVLAIGPSVVMWEHQHLSESLRKGIEDVAEMAGYEFERLRNDTMAWR